MCVNGEHFTGKHNTLDAKFSIKVTLKIHVFFKHDFFFVALQSSRYFIFRKKYLNFQHLIAFSVRYLKTIEIYDSILYIFI